MASKQHQIADQNFFASISKAMDPAKLDIFNGKPAGLLKDIADVLCMLKINFPEPHPQVVARIKALDTKMIDGLAVNGLTERAANSDYLIEVMKCAAEALPHDDPRTTAIVAAIMARQSIRNGQALDLRELSNPAAFAATIAKFSRAMAMSSYAPATRQRFEFGMKKEFDSINGELCGKHALEDNTSERRAFNAPNQNVGQNFSGPR